MKAETLNYEGRIYGDSKILEQFGFYSESLQLAKDHMRHILFTDSSYKLAEFRKITAWNWRQIRKTDYR